MWTLSLKDNFNAFFCVPWVEKGWKSGVCSVTATPTRYRRADNSRSVSYTVSAWDWVYATSLSHLQTQYFSENLVTPESNSGLWICSQELWPLDHRGGPNNNKSRVKVKLSPWQALEAWEILRIPHCLDNQLTDGGKVVSPTHPPRFTPQEHYYFFMFLVLISVRGWVNPRA
jgi:hypothetical protein